MNLGTRVLTSIFNTRVNICYFLEFLILHFVKFYVHWKKNFLNIHDVRLYLTFNGILSNMWIEFDLEAQGVFCVLDKPRYMQISVF